MIRTLAREPRRSCSAWASLSSHLFRLGIPFQRLPGVDGDERELAERGGAMRSLGRATVSFAEPDAIDEVLMSGWAAWC